MKFLRRQIKFAPTPLRATWPIPPDDRMEGINGNAKGVNDNPSPVRQVTQQEQDEEDNQKRREAMRDLVESWMDRLQLISVITTFFASTEASLLSISAPGSDGIPLSAVAQLANIGIIGSLVVHSSAAIISFLAAFFLIRYKLKLASNEERKVEHEHEKSGDKALAVVESPTSMGSFQNNLNKDQGKEVEEGFQRHINQPRGPIIEHDTDPVPGAIRVLTGSTRRRTVWSSNPHIIQVGPFQNNPPTHLLRRCHSLCVFLTVVGFVLALMGILCFAWDRLPSSVSISASVCMTMCVLSAVFILVKPYPPEGTSPHIYVLDEF